MSFGKNSYTGENTRDTLELQVSMSSNILSSHWMPRHYKLECLPLAWLLNLACTDRTPLWNISRWRAYKQREMRLPQLSGYWYKVD